MKFSAAIIALCAAIVSVEAVGIHHCNADGCLRALLPTRDAGRFASGAAFCATYLAAIPAKTNGAGAPPLATKSCGTDPKVYSSACSCVPFLPTPTL